MRNLRSDGSSQWPHMMDTKRPVALFPLDGLSSSSANPCTRGPSFFAYLTGTTRRHSVRKLEKRVEKQCDFAA